jgi:ribonuclease-3
MSVELLEERLGYVFKDHGLLVRSLQHPSLAGLVEGASSNEELEFLGDKVLGLSISEIVYHMYAGEGEGVMTKRVSDLVSRESCAIVAAELGVAEVLGVGGGIGCGKNTAPKNMTGDAMEAILGAVYIDGGLNAATAVINRLWCTLISECGQRSVDTDNPKVQLNERVQRLGSGHTPPLYELVGRSGPDHNPTFEVKVTVQDWGHVRAVGTGKSLKEAEKRAATALLQANPTWVAGNRDDGDTMV